MWQRWWSPVDGRRRAELRFSHLVEGFVTARDPPGQAGALNGKAGRLGGSAAWVVPEVFRNEVERIRSQA